jgi:hypothetical protein
MRYSKKELREAGKRYIGAIQGRLSAEGALNESDAELTRCLAPCVSGQWLVPTTKQLRDDGFKLVGVFA